MKFVFILLILFLIECEYNYRVNLYNLKDLENFDEKIEFVAQKNSDLHFKRAHFRWKKSNAGNLFPRYTIIKYRREIFVQHCLRIFGEEKLIDLIEKNKPNLIKKYGNTINEDIEVFEILIKHFSINDLKRIKRIK